MGNPIITPVVARQNIKTYHDQYYLALNDLQISYTNSMLYPDNAEYKRIYSTQLGAVNLIESNVFVLTNTIQSYINNLNGELTDINSKLKIEQSKNGVLKTTQTSFESDGNGSKLSLIDSKKIYNNQRYTNISMIVGIFLLLTTIIKINRQ